MKKSNLKISSSVSLENDLFYALVTVENELKVCMLVNEQLKIKLTLAEDIIIKDKLGTRAFRKYEYEDEETMEKYILVVNQSAGSFLFKELKQVDFIFIVKSASNSQFIEKSMLSLRKMNVFTVINKLDPSQFRNYSNLAE